MDMIGHDHVFADTPCVGFFPNSKQLLMHSIIVQNRIPVFSTHR
jgi:hypothetical protein